MRFLSPIIIACIFVSSACLGDDLNTVQPSNPQSEPDATIVMSGGSIAVGIGYIWGQGELVYAGQKHSFSVSGLSIVDVGVADIAATGVVYNLKNPADLNGNYAAVSAGLTVAGGGSASYLKNEHGVVIKLLATTQGLRFNLAAHGVHLKLTS
jgi:hypothetical protein